MILLIAGTRADYRPRTPVLLYPPDDTQVVHLPSLDVRDTPRGWLRCCFCERRFRVVDTAGDPVCLSPLTCSRHCSDRSLSRETRAQERREFAPRGRRRRLLAEAALISPHEARP